jgi:hypothetical protein
MLGKIKRTYKNSAEPSTIFPIFPVLPLLPEIGAGLVAAGEALTGLLAGSAIGATAMKAFEHGGECHQ